MVTVDYPTTHRNPATHTTPQGGHMRGQHTLRPGVSVLEQ